MNVLKNTKRVEEHVKPLAAASVEGEIREFVRRDLVARPAEPTELPTDKLSSLIDRVTDMSIKEIEALITELQSVRDFLKTEGERVQRELTGYAQVNQAAVATVKIVTDSVSQWKSAIRRPERA